MSHQGRCLPSVRNPGQTAPPTQRHSHRKREREREGEERVCVRQPKGGETERDEQVHLHSRRSARESEFSEQFHSVKKLCMRMARFHKRISSPPKESGVTLTGERIVGTASRPCPSLVRVSCDEYPGETQGQHSPLLPWI